MNTTSKIIKPLLATCLATLLAVGSGSVYAEQSDKMQRTYVDPLTGEVKQADKLLSEMTEAERSALSNEEYKALKDLEEKLKKHEKMLNAPGENN
ncbi:hypothetical protein [Arenicella xantha]|uniref:Uncharacterized protein n=1 Tax=Arenicella xantha TaxID=644221 RepID=A0A395JRI5_9GAMM|nr:hypothetical protein [Arenicella xantha]RBP51310.1 hypothetical protein DFR28_102729 [Arenicella xantha]